MVVFYELVRSGGIVALLMINLHMLLSGKVFSSVVVSQIVTLAVTETLEQMDKKS